MRFDGRLAGPIALLALALLAAPARPAGAQAGPGPARADETYHLRADRLSGSANTNDDVYTAIKVTVEHGTTTVTGDSARVYRQREQVEVMGNVKIVDGKTRMWGNQASYDRKKRLAVLRGNVRIEEGTARITGREAQFYRSENRSVILGNPRMEDSTRTLTANEITYDRNLDEVLALGNVVAVDRAESTTVHAGRVRYDRRRNYAWATESPALTIEESGGKSTRVRGLTMEFDNAKRAVFALGDVLVERDKLRATGDRGEFYGSENRALLVGTPRAWDDEGEVQGDTLEIRFAQHKVESVQVRPHAKVRYEAKVERGRGERTEAAGDTVTLFNPDEATRRAVIVGRAKSLYWPGSADSAQGGRNISSGDSIIVEFAGGKARRATVVGRAEGTYFMAAEGDTSRVNQEERVRYRGARIVYDVDRNEVLVLGSAEVTY
ncbi:MAG TPA: LptA/OstA family protein, partial [Candidatus Eisenbacteria bacterium]